MKLRSDFITNSSSSSFIVAFDDPIDDTFDFHHVELRSIEDYFDFIYNIEHDWETFEEFVNNNSDLDSIKFAKELKMTRQQMMFLLLLSGDITIISDNISYSSYEKIKEQLNNDKFVYSITVDNNYNPDVRYAISKHSGVILEENNY